MACVSKRTTAAAVTGSGRLEVSSSLLQSLDTIQSGGINRSSRRLTSHALFDHVLGQAGLLSGSSLLSTSRSIRKQSTLASSPTTMSPPFLISYASNPNWPFAKEAGGTPPNPLKIAILDSSFNPPSRAHYALATFHPDRFDGHLLLLSSKNVDKTPQPGDSSFEDRTAMMEVMAKHMQSSEPDKFSNIAVGSLAAATFAEKAPIIQEYLHASVTHREGQQYTLIFFIGFDTVLRLFMPKYYDNSEENMHKVLEKFFLQDNCQVICAKRPVENVAQQDVANQEEDKFFEREEVARYVKLGKLESADIEGTVGISSTKIRQALKSLSSNPNAETEEHLKQLILEDVLQICKEKHLYTS
jgi:nicotinamide-nucleotide adenylyltransferase